MLRALLTTTAAMVCLGMALGCNHGHKAPHPPRHSEPRTMTIQGSTPAAEPTSMTDPSSSAIQRPVVPEPAMSTPPIETVVDTPAPKPARGPTPTPPAPSRDASPYRDGCGRPLVA
jgi:hypothetical protein